ncbi:hypothetical protein O1611_g4869 [Lasiodiplodia mahajangana]|uniref:Uncharacterized protein n=1 Tax=Lasiodiplodia mahajangana TaxID=1108764 RepID=A0ACC2JMN3_9PEZI|nr:hypothetical protein O1611_g4869 [Lasiodiplodia mahajangana]
MKSSTGKPGTRRPEGVTKSARRRANQGACMSESSDSDNEIPTSSLTIPPTYHDQEKEDLLFLEDWDKKWAQRFQEMGLDVPLFGVEHPNVTRKIATQSIINAIQDVCPVCREDFTVGDVLSATDCKHTSHRACLGW